MVTHLPRVNSRSQGTTNFSKLRSMQWLQLSFSQFFQFILPRWTGHLIPSSHALERIATWQDSAVGHL